MQNFDKNSAPLDGQVLTRKRRKGIYILPNLFTLAALFGGFYAVVMAMNGRFDLAAVGVFCAMVLDSLDGRVARMTIPKVRLASRWTRCPTWCRLALRPH